MNMKLATALMAALLLWPLSAQAQPAAAVIYPSHAAMTWISESTVAPGAGELEIKGLPITLNDASLLVSLQGVAGAAVNSIKIARESASKKVTIGFEVEESGFLTAELRFKASGVSWRSEYNAQLNTSLIDRPGGEITLQHFGQIQQTSNINWNGVDVRLSASTAGPIMVASRSASDNRLLIAEHDISVDVELWSAPTKEQLGYYVATGVLGHGIPVLPGKAQLFRDGQAVGNTELPVLMRGDKFAIKFGVDERFQVKVSQPTSLAPPDAASNSEQWYLLELTNSHIGAIPLRLFSELPPSNDDTQKEIANARSFVLRPGSTSTILRHGRVAS